MVRACQRTRGSATRSPTPKTQKTSRSLRWAFSWPRNISGPLFSVHLHCTAAEIVCVLVFFLCVFVVVRFAVVLRCCFFCMSAVMVWMSGPVLFVRPFGFCRLIHITVTSKVRRELGFDLTQLVEKMEDTVRACACFYDHMYLVCPLSIFFAFLFDRYITCSWMKLKRVHLVKW